MVYFFCQDEQCNFAGPSRPRGSLEAIIGKLPKAIFGNRLRNIMGTPKRIPGPKGGMRAPAGGARLTAPKHVLLRLMQRLCHRGRVIVVLLHPHDAVEMILTMQDVESMCYR